MLKKRVIFTLLYDNQNFMLSRNFRLQKVGNIKWLNLNYKFSKISSSIDELIILNVGRIKKDKESFLMHIRKLTENCFIPIAAGGGVNDIEYAKSLLRNGADKVVVNTALFNNKNLIYSLSEEFGAQCIVASVDLKFENNTFSLWVENGTSKVDILPEIFLKNISEMPIGEIYLNSMDKDGTGQGYMMDLLDLLPKKTSIPIIIAGGAGNYRHLAEGLDDKQIDAVATAHLFNFVGDGLINARKKLFDNNYNLAKWL